MVDTKEQMIPVATSQAVPASQEDAKVDAARKAAEAAQKDLDPKAQAAIAEKASNYNPYEQEQLNNQRMFARDRLAVEIDPAVEVEAHAKIVGDAEKELADAQAKVDSAKATRDRSLKEAEDKAKEREDARDEALKNAKKK